MAKIRNWSGGVYVQVTFHCRKKKQVGEKDEEKCVHARNDMRCKT